MKSRYVFCPMTSRKLGRRVSLLARIRRRLRRNDPDLYEIIGYCTPVYPGK